MVGAIEWQGLGQAEERRLQAVGPNALPEQAAEPLWRRTVRQFHSPLVYMLLFALAVDLALWLGNGHHGLPLESLAIAVILLLNTALGVYQETKAEAALARLKRLAAPRIWAHRDGRWQQIAGSSLVPGDLVRLEAGDRVPADGVVRSCENLAVDESMLTGESLPVEHEPDEELLSGTLTVRGRAYLQVSRTGKASALGQLAALLDRVESEPTPLERRLRVFGDQVARWILTVTALVVLVGLLIEGIGQLGHVLLFAVALAVAAIPEGLPAVLTLTLALGVERMAGRRAVVRRLAAVEALGSVTVIASDKTGTLTANRLQVRALDTPDSERALVALVVANDAEAEAGDPLDVALLEYARTCGLDAVAVRRSRPRRAAQSFDSRSKCMHVRVSEGAREVSYIKGAPEVLLERCSLEEAQKNAWRARATAAATAGHRVLGIAWGDGLGEQDLLFLGLVLFWDPPRPEVQAAIAAAIAAGIRVLIVTGDHPGTAVAIARQIALPVDEVLTGDELDRLDPPALSELLRRTSVVARARPEHKLRLVEALQAQGEVVAMTGDGVNDAPALKRADVGVAMGQRGSDVSREVADLVLLDDNFATIVAAIEEGRGIYANVQKFLRFLFAANLALVLLVLGGTLGALVLALRESSGALLLPLSAAQLLWINFVTNGPPAIALGADRDPGAMRRRPRPATSPLLTAASLRFIFITASITAAVSLTLLAFLPYFGLEPLAARSAVFLYAALAQLLLVYPARRMGSKPLTNLFVHLAVALGVVLQLVAIGLAPLRQLLDLVALKPPLVLVMAALVLVSWLVGEAVGRRWGIDEPEF